MDHKSLHHIFDHNELNMCQRRWIELFSDYDCEIRYHLGKANVVADVLSRKERVKPRGVRAMSMTIQSSVKDKILAAQGEASKVENAQAEMLRDLDQQMEKRADSEGDLRKFSDIGAWEVPSFDKTKPQPQPLPNCPPLDISQGDKRGLEPPIKLHSPDSFRMKVVENLTIHTPSSSLVASSQPNDTYCYYRPCIDNPKRHYGFKPCLLGQSGSLGVDFSNLEMIENDWELESKEASFLEKGLNLPVWPKEIKREGLKK
ncbi:hypothetical protein Tco_0626448 [Tanacetum coccineum]|uniref:Reverse transcriptase domain-containing protein n=1 Tax=Tanacetum coccineum TaxID=301880 RepID=A0ABQ4WKE2_9ASTR